jgi:WD40 repeat protein
MSPDGHWLAWGNWHGNNAVVASLGADLPAVEFPVAGAASVEFTPDNGRLAVGGSDEIRFYEVGTWRQLYAIPRRPSSGIAPLFAFTRNSRLCAAASTDRVVLLDSATGEELGTLPASQHSMARPTFSPDDRFLAVASTDDNVLIWDLEELRGGLRQIGLDWELAPEGHR